jgi:hypothetical protein
MKYSQHVTEIVSAYSEAYQVSNEDAIFKVMEAMRTGQLVGFTTALKQKGYLQDLSAAHAKTATAIEGDSQKLTSSLLSQTGSIQERFMAVIDKIKGFAKGALSGFSGLKDKVAGLFPGTTPKADTGSFMEPPSLSDSDALKGNIDTIRKAVSSVAGSLDAPVRKTVEDVLTGAFDKAYVKVDKGTKKFAKTQTEHFKDLADEIHRIFSGMWIKVLEITDKAVEAIRKDTALTGSLVSLLSATAQIGAGPRDIDSVPDPVGARRLAGAEDATSLLVDAIHWPDWYSQDFRRVAYEMRDAMVGLASVLSKPGAVVGKGSASGELAKQGKRGKGAFNPDNTGAPNAFAVSGGQPTE